MTSLLVVLHFKPFWTDTFIATMCVQTSMAASCILSHTFIYVWKLEMNNLWSGRKKTLWFSSAPSSNFYNTKRRRAKLLVKYSVLGNTWNAYIFLMKWYFRSPSSFFNFFSEPRHLFFNLKGNEKKIKNCWPSSFLFFFWWEPRKLFFMALACISWLKSNAKVFAG